MWLRLPVLMNLMEASIHTTRGNSFNASWGIKYHILNASRNIIIFHHIHQPVHEAPHYCSVLIGYLQDDVIS